MGKRRYDESNFFKIKFVYGFKAPSGNKSSSALDKEVGSRELVRKIKCACFKRTPRVRTVGGNTACLLVKRRDRPSAQHRTDSQANTEPARRACPNLILAARLVEALYARNARYSV